MHLRNIAAAFSAAVLIAAPLALTGVAPASADEVWFQSIGRASADAKCAPSKADDLAAGWTEWAPSWGEWVNNGKGGWTCDRQITWAFSGGSGGWTPVCAPFGSESALFDTGPTLPAGSPKYAGRTCGTPNGTFVAAIYGGVYAPEGEDQARALCEEAFGRSNLSPITDPDNGDTAWFCV